jgi:hypothetical protein
VTRRNAKAEVLAVLAAGTWWSAREIQAATGLSAAAVVENLGQLTRYPWGRPRVETRARATATLARSTLTERLGHPVDPDTLKVGEVLHLPHPCRVNRVGHCSVTIEWHKEDAPDAPSRGGVFEYRLRTDPA